MLHAPTHCKRCGRLNSSHERGRQLDGAWPRRRVTPVSFCNVTYCSLETGWQQQRIKSGSEEKKNALRKNKTVCCANRAWPIHSLCLSLVYSCLVFVGATNLLPLHDLGPNNHLHEAPTLAVVEHEVGTVYERFGSLSHVMAPDELTLTNLYSNAVPAGSDSEYVHSGLAAV